MDPRRTRALRAALGANAVLSTTTGLWLLLGAGGIASWLGDVPPPVLRAVGASLLVFVLIITRVIVRPHPVVALVVTALDLGWVLGTAGILLFASGIFTSLGQAALVGVAGLVGAAAGAQIAGVRRMLRDTQPGRGDWYHCVAVDVDASPDAMWAVVSDLSQIRRFSPSLVRSSLRDGEVSGVGALRTCRDDRGREWSEACERFDPAARELDVRFVAEAPDFPFPAEVMVGGWRVRPHGDGSRVEVWWSLTPTTPLPWLAVALLGLSVDRGMAEAIARMAEAAHGRPVPEVPPRLTWAAC